MELKSITIEGFLSYYEKTAINFSEGTTIIIGKNNSGKSKLFDAINWGMYERVYDSNAKKWVVMFDTLSKMVLNRRTRKEAVVNKSKACASVQIQLTAEDYPDNDLTIERTYLYDFSDGLGRCEKDLEFYIQDDMNGEILEHFSGDDAEKKIVSICPSKIRDFVLFQGEEADKLMLLSQKNQTAIEQAVRQVARLSLFEKATEIAKSYAHSKYLAITRVNSANKTLEDKKQVITKEIDRYTEQLEAKKKRKDDVDGQLLQLSEVLTTQRATLSNQEDLSKLFKERDSLLFQQKRIRERLMGYKEINKSISDTWVFYKVVDKIKSFSSFYGQLELKGQVPPTISQSEIRKSLDQHCCSLCGCELKEGSNHFMNVHKKLQSDVVDTLGRTLSSLNYSFNNKLYDIENVPKLIDEYVSTRANEEKNKQDLQNQLAELQTKIDTVKISEDDESKQQKLDDLRHIFAKNEENYKNLKDESSRLQGSIDDCQDWCNQKKKELLDLVSQGGSVQIEDKVKLYYARKLDEAMSKLCTAAQNLAYSEIQKAANDYYHEMVKDNPALVGDIRIDKDKSEIYSVDDYGDKITDMNTGNRVAIQLAVSAGILTVAGNQFNSYYPFVTDAPTSHLDAINKIRTITCMIKAFEQSIIIVKDDSDENHKDPIYDLIDKNKDISLAYQLRVHKEDGYDINDQYTEVVILKGGKK